MLRGEYCPNKSQLSVVDSEDFLNCVLYGVCRNFINAVNRILFTLSDDENEYHQPEMMTMMMI